MKIVILSFYSGVKIRGVESFINDFCCFVGKKNEMMVFKNKNYINFDHQFSNFFRYFYLDYFSLKILFFTLKALPMLITEKPDILLPVNNGWQSILAKIYCFFSGAKLVLQGHAGPGRDDLLNLKLRPDVFVCFTQVQEKWANKNSFCPTVVIPQGVNLQMFNPGIKPTNLDLKKPIILCVSALDSYKNVSLVVKAVSEMIDTSLFLVCSGTVKQKNNLASLAGKILGKRFKMITADHKELPGIYNSASVFTLVSSSREAFGRVYLEAMACNLPVVATEDELRREIIGNAGLFVDNPQNTKDYAQILQKSLMRTWGQLPRRQAEKYSWQIIALKYHQLFKKLLND